MKFPILYQKDSSGNIKQWSIEVIDQSSHSEMISISGRIDGTQTPNSTIIDIGKGNKTHFEQACSDAQSKFNSKIKKGYVDDINNVKESSELGSGRKSSMLAQKYDPTLKLPGSKNLKQIGIEGILIGAQRKKDGNRCEAHVKNENGFFSCELSTRSGDKFAPLPHIENQIVECFKKIYKYVNEKYGVTEYCIDGELMPPKDDDGLLMFSFNKLNGLVSNFSRTPEQEELAKTIEYHIYDVILPVGYETRDKIKNYFSHTHLKPLVTDYVIATEENLKALIEKYLEEGEEGLMIRQLGKPYEHKRTWQLIKYKLFDDAEFEIVGFKESVRKNMVGSIYFKAPAGCYDRDGKLIETFKAACKFDLKERKKMWDNQQYYIGKQATVEFFGYSEYGIPRFGKCKKFREDWDK